MKPVKIIEINKETTGCIKKLYTLGFEPISQLSIQFQQSFYTFSMCQTHTVAKNVRICIPTTKYDQDIEYFVKYVKKRKRTR